MALFAAPKNSFYPFMDSMWGEVNKLNPKPQFSAIKRVFFTPVDQRKFNEMRDRQQREILRIDLFNIR
ncbi:hypothetical protein [Arthrobacter wenxiniae]|jgi:hypothetical protein|uniref:hypothetical protein n=1 Tax=Arthrobacter wenxiniae TaxID=2713570 RepID=UPI001C3FF7D2|nr:hypothetical protein [Arthrobacter wenxiniae]